METTNPVHAQPITLDQLQSILDAAKAKCPDLASRLDRAASLLITRRIERGESGRVWFVQSETDLEREYAVAIFKGGPWVCECQDYKRRQQWCKHGLAVALLRRCQEQAETPPP